MQFQSWIKCKWMRFYVKIVREKASPEYVARGWAIGMFYGCSIPFGLQLVCSLPTAFLLKGSKIGATLGTLLTNHLTIFLIYPLQCFIGNRLIGGTLTYQEIETAFENVLKEQSYQALWSIGGELVASFFLGGLLFAVILTPLTYYLILILVIQYRKRAARRMAARQSTTSA